MGQVTLLLQFLLAFPLIRFATALAPSSSQILLPKPTGFYQVGRGVHELVDHNRTQPFASEIEPRRLMISIFYPVQPQYEYRANAYLPPETARIEDHNLSDTGTSLGKGTLQKLALQLAGHHRDLDSKVQEPQDHPLVLFMPAEGTIRLFYSEIACMIASDGYVVTTIDTPYDVDVIEYPDGSLVYLNQTVGDLTEDVQSNLTLFAEIAKLAIRTRVQDVSFVLDCLSNSSLAHDLVPHLPVYGLNTTRTAMFGHSLGGATAFSVLEADSRVLGGLDMDGGLYGPGLEHGTTKPFMLMGHANHTRGSRADDPLLSWKRAWPNIRGWKRDVMVAGTQHYDFSDFPIIFEECGIPISQKSGEPLGPIRGSRALKIVTTYVGAFLDFVIYGQGSALLEGPVPEFPEVTFEW